MVEAVEQADSIDRRRVALLDIFLAFTRVSIVSIGGGLTAWVHHELVERRRWVDDKRFLSAMAICQVLPGGNMVNMTVYTGTQLRGLAGAVAALLGICVVPALAIIGLAALYSLVRPYATTALALDGVAASAVGLSLALGWREARHSARRGVPLAVAAATFLGVGVLHWPLLVVVGVLAPLSVLLAFMMRRADG